MATRRTIKKDINFMLGDLIEECYSEMLYHPGKKDDAINKTIDEIVDLADNLITRVNQHGKFKTRKEMKTHFKKIALDLEGSTLKFVEKINKI